VVRCGVAQSLVSGGAALAADACAFGSAETFYPMTNSQMTWPPLTNEMPDLSALVPSKTLTLALRLAFPGDRTDAYPARLLHVTFVRLVDRAISE
jgi:hypothetical protein